MVGNDCLEVVDSIEIDWNRIELWDGTRSMFADCYDVDDENSDISDCYCGERTCTSSMMNSMVMTKRTQA